MKPQTTINYAGSADERYKAAAPYYPNRPRWSEEFIKSALEAACDQDISSLMIADCGAGDGAPGRVMIKIGCDSRNIFQIEPNADMRRLNEEKGGLNISPGTATNTFLPSAKFHIVTYFNSAHQLGAEADKVRRENQRILKPTGKIIIAAQRFDPADRLIQAMDAACDDWKKRGLYPDYGNNGHRFILNSSSGANNARAILTECCELYIAEGRQEIIANNVTKYNAKDFEGLFRSYLSFPKSPSEELLNEIKSLHQSYADKAGFVSIPCVQVAIIGNAKVPEKEVGLSRL